jgi:hypothetical protein
MSVDFAALTAAVGAGLSEVRACLIVSRDGLALGSYPPAEEASAMEKWMRLASLGDVERGFAVVGEECWVFCSRGPYSALAVARASVRPGIILEHLDQMVLAAEEARLRKEGISPSSPRDADAAAAAARRRRATAPPTGIHPASSQQPPRQPERIDLRRAGESDVAVQRSAPATAAPATPAPLAPTAPGQPSPEEAPVTMPEAPTGWGAQPEAPAPEGEQPGKAPGERTLWVMNADDLTREFAALLEDPDDEGRP